MQKSDIHPGVECAFREKRTPGTPLEHVRVLQHARANRWKVEWIEPNPGLIHYASTQLVAPWKERKTFLQEEANEQRLRKHNEQHGYRPFTGLVNLPNRPCS